MTAAKFVNELIALQGAGRFSEMETRAHVYLKSQPSSPILNELLGIAMTGQQRFAEALPFLEKAVRRQPDDPQFCENLALCLRELNQHATAERYLRRALELRPRSVEALNALGSVLSELGRPAEAETAFRGALDIDPGHPAANFNLGKALLKPDAFSEANALFERAVSRLPDLLPAVHICLGRYFARIGLAVKAEESFRKAVGGAPALALVALAGLFAETGRQSEATSICDQVLSWIPDIREAVRSGNELALRDLASVLYMQNRSFEATAIYRALWETRADPMIALAAYGAARAACDWEFAQTVETAALAAIKGANSTEVSVSIFSLSSPSVTRGDQLAAAKLDAALFAQGVVDIAPRMPSPTDRGRRLRIGYLSGDFYDHATSHLLAGVIEAHDRNAFEVVAYDHSPQVEGDYRRRLTRGFDRFVSVHTLSNSELAQAIAGDRIDIIVDLKGWTQGTRCAVLASRPAPVQVQWLGYPGTLGASWIDYIIADPVLIREGEERDYSEKVIRLPHSYQPNDRARPIASVPTREEVGLPSSGVVFCSFNQTFKLTPEIFSLWTDLLAGVEGSVLWLLECPAPVMAHLRQRTEAAGISPSRLLFAPKKPIADHLARTSLADLVLDCFPYGAHTTASDALWAGVPFVALAGDTLASRVSASLLTALGMPELITTSPRAYCDLAFRLATDPQMRSAVRSRIVSLRDTAPLFDTRRFTRNLETAYVMGWERWASGRGPDHLDVPDAGA